MSSSPRLGAAIKRVATEIRRLPDKPSRQIRVIQLINEFTGSTFTGANLSDPLGRFLAFAAWPLPPERIKLIQELSPMLQALLIAAPMHRIIWDERPNRAFAFPESLYRSTQAYRHAYRKVDMHHAGFYCYAPRSDSNYVIVMVSRPDRSFSQREIECLQHICDRFSTILNRMESAPGGTRASTAADHTIELDEQLRPKAVSAYAGALISLFYGPAAEGELPAVLAEEIEQCRREYRSSVLPASEGAFFAITKRSRGRTLCLTFQSDTGNAGRLTCYEDLTQFARLRKLREKCGALSRDKYSVFSACLSVLEGEQTDSKIKKSAGLSALRDSSARRIISRARGIVASL